VGASHRTAPLSILESIALAPEQIVEFLPEIRDRAGLSEIFILSTCNRTEVYGTATDPLPPAEKIEDWLLELSRRRSPLGQEHIYHRFNQDAVDHLFRVTCGVNSMMVGETEIAGQVEAALSLARRAGTAGNFVTQLFSATSRTCKRARTETSIGAGAVSVASASVHLAERVFGQLDRRTILVVGAGDTGSLAARHFQKHHPQGLCIANRTLERAESLAAEVGGSALPLDRRMEVLPTVDIVVCATHSPEPLFTEEVVREAMKSRPSRVLLLIDISMPSNVEAGVAKIDNVFLDDMNDLHRIVEHNLARRAKEIPAVERIVHEEAENFFRSQASMRAGPLIRDLRGKYEEVRLQELDRYLAQFAEQDRDLAERLTRDIVQKLLHHPSIEIRSVARHPETNRERLLWVRRLFGLEPVEDGKSKS
jgi:glutamyl-tRNA reductase